jgi:hypothetical protein
MIYILIFSVTHAGIVNFNRENSCLKILKRSITTYKMYIVLVNFIYKIFASDNKNKLIIEL